MSFIDAAAFPLGFSRTTHAANTTTTIIPANTNRKVAWISVTSGTPTTSATFVLQGIGGGTVFGQFAIGGAGVGTSFIIPSFQAPAAGLELVRDAIGTTISITVVFVTM